MRTIALLVAATACAIACSNTSGAPATGERPPNDAGSDTATEGDSNAPPDANTPSDSNVPPDSSTSGDGGAGGETSADGSGGGTDGTTGGGDSGDAGIPSTASCNPTHVWAPVNGVDPSIPTTGFEQFGGVSRDELTVAWTTTSGAIQVADRTSKGSPFNSPVTVTGAPTALANDRVALSWTGLLLLVVSMDRSSLVELTRQSVGSTWAEVNPVDLAEINALSGGGFSQPVLGDDGKTLYFLWTQSGQPPALYTSNWDTQVAAWGPPIELQNTELTSTDATHRRRPTGGSSDGLTLFFYDEIAGKERGAWRSSSTSSFTEFVDIGTVPEAAPNQVCDTLYYQGVNPEAGGEGLGLAF